MAVPFSGRVTQRDLIRIFRLGLKTKRWMLFVCGPLALVSIIFVGINSRNAVSYLFLIMTLFFAFMAAYPFWGALAAARSAYRRQVEIRSLYWGEISEEEVLLHTDNVTQSVKWAVYGKVVRNKGIVLLFQKNANFFQFFPRTFFATDVDWQEFQKI